MEIALTGKRMYEHCEESASLYKEAIANGMCPEQARFFLPQGTKVNWVLTGSLFAFSICTTSAATRTHNEIQMLAEQIGEIIAPLYPVSWSRINSEGNY